MGYTLKKYKILQSSLGLLLSIFMVACGQPTALLSNMSSEAIDNLGCQSLQSVTFDELYKISENQKEWPRSKDLKEALKERWKKDSRSQKISKEKMEEFFKEYSAILDAIKDRLPADWETLSREDRLGILAAIEMQDDTTLFKEKLNQSFQSTWNKVQVSQLPMKSQCSAPQRLGDFKKSNEPEIYGSRKVFATAYQGCSSIELPVMDDRSPAVAGIVITGTHPAGGKRREINDVQKAYQTHYYISQQQPDTQCKDLSRSPLIYDFGGKPYASSSNQSTLNFFVNSGSGTKVLGVDCGGYVFSAMMVGGLRLKSNIPMKAVHIYNISASANPQANKYDCLDFVSTNKGVDMEPGDIVSTPAHIIMIDQVGDDPLAIDSITRVEDCREGMINSNNFNFVISQSSPSKGGIGINRILASTYLKETPSYRQGFVSYAIAACKARFGVNVAPNRSSFWWIRHKKTAECRQPEISLDSESCISSCL